MNESTTAGVRVPPGHFRSLMGSFPTGVAVVTAGTRGSPVGMTCSSLCSVSIAPPTLLVCLRLGSPTLAGVLAGSSFAVNLLHAGAQRTAELFASGAPDRFDRVDWCWDVSAAGPHLVADAHVVGDCEVSAVESVGDHAVVFGQVTRVSTGVRTGPLLYGLHAYRSWPQ